jgi:dephospho-CoA kinase
MIVGLTGGIGSGKTTVAKLFYKLGVPIYVSDIEAKKIMITSEKVIAAIKNLLGDEAYNDENELNRSYISDKIFKNKSLLNDLNSIVHPAVAEDFLRWYKEQDAEYVIKESAILFESGSFKNCDLVITVTAPLEERIKRVVLRDNVTKKQVLHRVMNQLSDEDKIDQSDFIINNKTIEATENQVKKINTQILNILRNNSSF